MFITGPMTPLTSTSLMSEDRLQSEVVKYISLQYPKAKYCASLGGQYQPYQSQRKRAKRN